MKTVIAILIFASSALSQAQTPKSTQQQLPAGSQIDTSDETTTLLRNYFNLGTTHVIPGPQTQMQSPFPDEGSFLKNFRGGTSGRSHLKAHDATGSGNGGNTIAFDFAEAARNTFDACHTREAAGTGWVDPRAIQIFAVSFPLCENSGCDLVAKAHPEDHLILVNAKAWATADADTRTTAAASAYLATMGLTLKDMGLKTTVHLERMQTSRSAITTYCVSK